MLRFPDPETAVFLRFLDPEIVEMDQKISGSRNCRNGAISGSRNRRNGRQILYPPEQHITPLNIHIFSDTPFSHRMSAQIKLNLFTNTILNMNQVVNPKH